ncbi:MAG: permease [Bacillota bacterium]|nr:permease [Bacillota bacterium]
MNVLIENNQLMINILSYAGELILRVVPMLIAAVFLAEAARLMLGEEKLRTLLVGRNIWTGRLRAAALGAVLPFCECGAFPVMLGLIRAGIPASAVLSFFPGQPRRQHAGLYDPDQGIRSPTGPVLPADYHIICSCWRNTARKIWQQVGDLQGRHSSHG